WRPPERLRLTQAKVGEVSTFLATIPGLLKVFETYLACLIFSLVASYQIYAEKPGLQWCLAVYCICFIVTLLIVILTIGRCLATLPIPLEKSLVGFNSLAVLLYLTAAVVWPIYAFEGSSRPSTCFRTNPQCIKWNNKLGVTFLTIFNLIATPRLCPDSFIGWCFVCSSLFNTSFHFRTIPCMD
uniref:MARVEL domain-containing protein n=1 Tax=Podarcis muralis TaxID=64176 RepID=A0A670K268_PODMU